MHPSHPVDPANPTGPAGSVSRERDRFARPVHIGTNRRETGPVIELAPLLGTWVNFDRTSRGILRAELARAGDALTVRPFGASDSGLLEWGSAAATVLSDDVARTRAIGLIAAFDLRFQRVVLYGYVNRGLLTFEAATTFTDDSPRARYLTRQHFYRLPR
ncbi:hypothetical protein [Pendulispora albinea]|uniref:Uncharacterized protein n=1 Tax=Pendulispora albinea TaxID=2741071 RepID=A0ABZ2MBJ3_9BACT